VTNEVRRDWLDLGWSAVIHELLPTSTGEIARVTFAVYEHAAFSEDGAILLLKKGDDSCMEFVEGAGEAEIALFGEIKFDDTSVWWIDPTEGPIFLQTGGRTALKCFGKMMAECHDWAGEIMGGFK
jgi:hypothetical protein